MPRRACAEAGAGDGLRTGEAESGRLVGVGASQTGLISEPKDNFRNFELICFC